MQLDPSLLLDIAIGIGGAGGGWYTEHKRVKPRLEEAERKREEAEKKRKQADKERQTAQEARQEAESIREKLKEDKQKLEKQLDETEKAAKNSFDAASPYEIQSIQNFVRLNTSAGGVFKKTFSSIEFDQWIPEHLDIPYRCGVRCPNAHLEDISLDEEVSSQGVSVMSRPGVEHENRWTSEAVLRIHGPITPDKPPKQIGIKIPMTKGYCETWQELNETFPKLNPMKERDTCPVPAPTGQIVFIMQFPEEYTDLLDWLDPEAIAVQVWTDTLARGQTKRIEDNFELIDPREEAGVDRPKAKVTVAPPVPGYSYGICWRPPKEDMLQELNAERP